MLNHFQPKITMTVEEFLKYNNKEITLKEISFNHRCEKFARKLKENKRLERFIAFLLAVTLMARDTVYAASNKGGIEGLGIKVLSIVRHWSKWVLIVLCVMEILKGGVHQNSEDVLKIILKYLLIYAAMYLVPELFDLIEQHFG